MHYAIFESIRFVAQRIFYELIQICRLFLDLYHTDASLSFLHQIVLTQFKNYRQVRFSFQAKVVGIVGNNGAGKTNLLDAIYYLCFSKSYFQSREINNVQSGAEGFRLEGHFSDGQLVITWREGKKKILENEVPMERIQDFIGRRTALMIAPDDIALINGGSELRRRFVDALLSQSDAYYFEMLLHYQKILAQRNAYLKQSMFGHVDHQLLDIYDGQLVASGSYIMQQRACFSQKLPALVSSFYQDISGNAEPLDIAYQSNGDSQNFGIALSTHRSRDIEARRTTIGPHTEDWLFYLDGKPCKTQASQGQKKSFLIALKLAQLEWLRQLGKTPIVLLDDIFEKLDEQRLSALFQLLGSLAIPQIFMTHVDEVAIRQHTQVLGEVDVLKVQ